MINALCLQQMTLKHGFKLGTRKGCRVDAVIVVPWPCFLDFNHPIYDRFIRRLGFVLPSPTMFRAVSGRVTINMQRQREDMIVNVQKIQRQPAYCTRMPPNTGPRLGATLGQNHRSDHYAVMGMRADVPEKDSPNKSSPLRRSGDVAYYRIAKRNSPCVHSE